MIVPSWTIEEPDPADVLSDRSQPALVTLHFLRAALRRAWPVWMGLAFVGMLLGIAWTQVVPAKSVGTVTLLLAHDPGTEPTQAMATDVSLLRTRAVAGVVIKRLNLDVTPEDFQKWVTATPATTTVLVLSIPAPDDREAVARAKALSESYLAFRTAQIRSQSDALVRGYRQRVEALQQRVADLTAQYNQLSARGPEAQSEATDVLTQRTQLNAQINTLQGTMQDAALKSGSIVTASHVLDPPSAMPASPKKRLVLCAASGLIGGAAVGTGLVMFMALTSSRLRRRDEVALALASPVRVSVTGLRPRRARLPLPLPGSSSARDVQILVRALESAISPRGGRPVRMALGAVDHPHAARSVLAALVGQLTLREMRVFVVDLSEQGGLARSVRRELRAHGHDGGSEVATPVVYRPEGLPCLARGPIDTPTGVAADLPTGDPRRAAWDAADVVLVLDDLDPAIGVDHLRSWTDRVVLLVTAGRSTAERLRTTAELIRSAGLQLPFAMLVGADRGDESLGLPEPLDAGRPEARETS